MAKTTISKRLWKYAKNFGVFLFVGASLVALFFLSRWLMRSNDLSPDGSAARIRADRSFQQEDWANASVNYQRMLDADPFNPTAQYRKSYSLHQQFIAALKQQSESGQRSAEVNRLAGEAIASYQASLDYPHLRDRAHYNIACIHAQLGDKEQALSELTKAMRLGISRHFVSQDSDLQILHDDPRYQALFENITTNQHRGIIVD